VSFDRVYAFKLFLKDPEQKEDKVWW